MMDGEMRAQLATPMPTPTSRWNAVEAAGLSEAQLVVYRSRLLGSDLAVTNYGGGNTSAKVVEMDPLTGATADVLWVKGSGGDLGTIEADGFATLYLDRLQALDLRYPGVEREDEMPGLLAHCTFNLNPRAASIDTPIHGLLGFRHIDHMHPDSVTALAAAADGEALTKEIYGDRIGWLAWRRPGWELARELAALAAARPEMRGVVLQNHGLVTWADTAVECYELTIEVIAAAAAFLNTRLATGLAFGGEAVPARPAAERRALAVPLMSRLRALTATTGGKIGHFVDTPEILEFAGSADLQRLAAIGTSCPDHFLRTKIRPLVVSASDDEATLAAAVNGYRQAYAAYYEACRHDDSPALRDPNPVLFVVPGVGLIAFAKDKATARIATEFFTNAINVMRGAEAVSRYQGLSDQEAFDIEYWSLEEAKLRRMPASKPLAGKIALITGGAGGIGRATAARLLADGACVSLIDRDQAALDEAESALGEATGRDRIITVLADVTDETAVAAAANATVLAFGGLDILVANAGLAASSPIEETSLAQWREAYAVLADGYFLASRAAFSLMKAQGGGSIVFVASKNALVASPNTAAYSSAKAAELHLARCLALEGAPHGIRVNVVNPDAVLRGSRIWSGAWKTERAAAYGVKEDDLEEYYRKRNLLQTAIYPEDVAEGIAFLAGPLAAKSTGNILNVDGGNLTAFTR
jgi:rhamnulose-1-phosphate aldolase/alcohol dehydrogenase